jgi:DNA (cytosine-5)-methyltransferase 1
LEVAWRIGEIVKRVYFASKPRRDGSPPSLGTLLARLKLEESDFDESALVALRAHARAVCQERPKCGACPLVSFCSTGKQRVKQSAAPVVVDLFAGAGGMGRGFRKAGFRVGLAIEMDAEAAQTYRLNNPGVVVVERDIRRVTARDIMSVIGARPAVICAGPPCQSYSVAGARESRDPRHNLFKHVLDVARVLKPEVVLIENVPGINRRVGRKNYKDVVETRLGEHFEVEVHLLRALDYGVPQQRRRYFFLGRNKSLSAIGEPRKTHREKGQGGGLPEAPTVMDALRGLPRRPQGSVRDWSRLGDGRVVWNMATMRHSRRVVKKIMRLKSGEGPLSYRRVSRKYANTIIAGHRALPVHPTLHRTLSVREAATIQGFDESYSFLGTRANQPLQVANAVPPPLAYGIARRIMTRLKQRAGG